MGNFQTALTQTLAHEGGYQANPNDPGNYNSRGELVGTNWGISAPRLEKHLGRPPTAEDMKSLPIGLAAEIYRDYWTAIRGDEIESARVAGLLFDMAVNHGPRSAIRLAQRVAGVKADGKIGPVTLAAINAKGEAEMVGRLIGERIGLYRAIIRRRPNMAVFLRGWIRRAESFLGK